MLFGRNGGAWMASAAADGWQSFIIPRQQHNNSNIARNNISVLSYIYSITLSFSFYFFLFHRELGDLRATLLLFFK
jgi:hypothetical protein